MTNSCCGLGLIFCTFILHLIGQETINIPEIFSGIHGFTGKTVIQPRGERCFESKVSCQEQNAMSLARAQTWTAQSKDEHTNREPNVPPPMASTA